MDVIPYRLRNERGSSFRLPISQTAVNFRVKLNDLNAISCKDKMESPMSFDHGIRSRYHVPRDRCTSLFIQKNVAETNLKDIRVKYNQSNTPLAKKPSQIHTKPQT